MISRSTLEAAKRVAEQAACRPIVLKLSAPFTSPAVDEPNPDVRIERAAAAAESSAEQPRQPGGEHLDLVAGTSEP